MAEEHKSWWQTAAGLMTGIAALITALTGLFVALHQIRKDSEEGRRPPVTEQSASTQGPLPGEGSKALPGARLPGATSGPSSMEGARTPLRTKQPRMATAPAIDRSAYSVALPAKHEFVLGSGLQTSRFILTSVRMEPHTVESDILKVSVQVLVDGQVEFPFNSLQFELRIDERPYRSTTDFNEFIPVGQSRDHDLHFTIPHGVNRAVLWIHERLSNAEIPLDLTGHQITGAG
jgi:hypothetical protein